MIPRTERQTQNRVVAMSRDRASKRNIEREPLRAPLKPRGYTDTKISILEARRNKTRDLKQGMMQELLTGMTRLV